MKKKTATNKICATSSRFINIRFHSSATIDSIWIWSRIRSLNWFLFLFCLKEKNKQVSFSKVYVLSCALSALRDKCNKKCAFKCPLTNNKKNVPENQWARVLNFDWLRIHRAIVRGATSHFGNVFVCLLSARHFCYGAISKHIRLKFYF